jgi:uncharacterized membrane protein YjgN (DUF898 family)
MTTLDATVPAVPTSMSASLRMARFLGRGAAFWKLLARGGVLLMFTLGIYRFWLTTDIRRFLWSNTEINDESFEYTGTPRELLLGFLIAIALLVPLYSAFFLLTLTLGQIWTVLSIIALTFLGQYAVFRARRYRLTRTIYRGVRFHQTGSAWRYSVYAVLWWTLIVLSLGLAYPFAQSQLERFKMRNTFYGTLPGRFEGSAWHLFLRGFVLWLLAAVPFTMGVVATIRAIDWNALTSVAAGDDKVSWLENSGLAGAVVFAALTGIWLLLSFAIFYPAFQTMVLRWWVSGLRFGEVAVNSRLLMTQVFAVYARFLGYAVLFTFIVLVALTLGALVVSGIAGALAETAKEIVSTVLLLGAYVAAALGYSTIYQATVKLGLWRCVIETLDISNPVALANAAAAGEPASPIGEGLADALNVGGL